MVYNQQSLSQQQQQQQHSYNKNKLYRTIAELFPYLAWHQGYLFGLL